MLREIKALLIKELMIEWKQKYAFNGLLLYVVSMVVVISLAFNLSLNPIIWNIIYWIMVLFVAINAVARSFMGESVGQQMYIYGLARPGAVILSKMIYNSLLLVVISLVTWLFSLFLSDIHVANLGEMAGLIVIGSLSISANLTLISAIASRAENRTTLLAVLGFPVVIPILLLLIRATKRSVEGLVNENSLNELGFLLGISLSLWVISVILFPFIWRE